jgi:hypothetical protein
MPKFGGANQIGFHKLNTVQIISTRKLRTMQRPHVRCFIGSSLMVCIRVETSSFVLTQNSALRTRYFYAACIGRGTLRYTARKNNSVSSAFVTIYMKITPTTDTDAIKSTVSE